VSARLVGAGGVRSHDVESAGAQLAGAAGVAVLASVPVVLFPASVELELVELLLAGFIALVGFAVARGGGATRARASVYAVSVLVGRRRHRAGEERPRRPRTGRLPAGWNRRMAPTGLLQAAPKGHR
jgi:hypothetical protein